VQEGRGFVKQKLHGSVDPRVGRILRLRVELLGLLGHLRAFAAVVILLIWLWLTSSVLLFGAELNAVVDQRRALNLPPGYDGPVLPPKEPAEA
jgi:hypothetical protein